MSIRCAVIGYGMGEHHAHLIEKAAGLELVAVCDVDPARRDRALSQRPHLRTYDDPRKLFGDADVDLVVIVTPHDTHCALAVAAAKAGKHVVTDKVMCMSVREADRMIAAASEAGVMLSVFQNRRWDGDFMTVRRIIEEGALGPIFEVESAIGGFGVPGGWRREKKHGGGQIMDWGAHLVDQANILGGFRPVTVFADLRTLVHSVDVDTHAKVTIRYDSGLVADVEVSCVSWLERPRWRIRGEAGALEKATIGGDPVRLRAQVGSFTATMEIPPMPTTWESYYENVAAHLLNGAELAVKPEESRVCMQVMDAAFASAAKGSSVKVAG